MMLARLRAASARSRGGSVSFGGSIGLVRATAIHAV
jgi:hypothetical protein